VPTSDAAANATLNLEVTAGGSWWVGLALNSGTGDIDPQLTVAVEESTLPRVELPRTDAAWESAAGRQVQPVTAVDFGTATDDETVTHWVLWDAPTGGAPQRAARIPDTEIVAGSRVLLPAESLILSTP